MKTILALALSVLTPTLVDVSDYENYQQGVPKYVTEEIIQNKGYVEGSLTLADGHYPEIGLVDQDAYPYTDCGEGCQYFVSKWFVRAWIDREQGLTIYDGGTLLYQQSEPYEKFAAVVRVQVKGVHLNWYLNGELMFSSEHDLAGKELRGYYYDDISSPMIGVPRGGF